MAAAALGLGFTLFSTLVPALQATCISPLTALREQVATGIQRAAVGRAPGGTADLLQRSLSI